MARVRHPAVVEILDAGTLPNGRPYLAMTLLHGETLAERLSHAGALPVVAALRLFAELADATAALHDAGLLHRDLKPENVFLLDEGRGVKLLDLGIAKDRSAAPSTTTQAGMARGTPATMAPERFFGAPATESSDVYELAVVLYAMLVGRLPWTDATDVEVRLHPESPLDAGIRIPRKLSAELMRALSTRPERRPPSVRDFAERIRVEGETLADERPARVTAATSTMPPPADRDDAVASAEVALAPTVAIRSLAGESAGQTHIKDAVTQPREVTPRSRALFLAAIAVLVTALGLVFVRSGSHAAAPSVEPTVAEPLLQNDHVAADPRPPEPTVPAVTPTSSARTEPPSAHPQKPGAARASGRDARPSGSGAPVSVPAAAAASELPGGVYEKPPY